MTEEHFHFALTSSVDQEAVNNFLDQLDGSEVLDQPDGSEASRARDKLYDMRDLFLGHLEIESDPDTQQSAGEAFFRSAVYVFAGLYAAYGKVVPEGFLDVLEGLLPGFEHEGNIKERHDFFYSFGTISKRWISAFENQAYGEGLCGHAVGQMYAFAEAFVRAVEREKAQEAS